MPAISLNIKHAAKTHSLSDFDPASGPSGLRQKIYKVTGVPVDRMKVMLKTGLLKDTTDLSKVLSDGVTVNVIGTAGPLPQAPPVGQVKFLEDMDESEVLKGVKTAPGLVNLGNTCYMNASLQALRMIPELGDALETYNPPSGSTSIALSSPDAKLTSSLKQLFSSMNKTTDSFPPLYFLSTLRQINPQFAEQSRNGGYAQQDADEMWTQTISALHATLRSPSDPSGTSFIDKYMAAELQQTLTCDEAPEETPSTKVDKVFKLDCNISINTNYLMTGIMDSFDQKIEKHSPSLNRTAVYTQKSRLTRLPANLTVHMVRFYWRADIQKKAKIMRKVKFPMELDVLDLLTDEMQEKIRPINIAVKNVDKARMERAKIRKRTKKLRDEADRAVASRPTTALGGADEENMKELQASEAAAEKLEDESAMQAKERVDIEKLVEEKGLKGSGANTSALYELCAVVTHKGASADSGHYIGWTRQEDTNAVPGEENWYKFDDDKVSAVDREKILSLDGGGEDSVAYILVYRTKNL